MKKVIGSFISSLLIMFGMLFFSTQSGGHSFSIIVEQLFLSLQVLQIGNFLPLIALTIGGFVGGFIAKDIGRMIGVTTTVIGLLFITFLLLFPIPVNFLDFLLFDLVTYLIFATIGAILRR